MFQWPDLALLSLAKYHCFEPGFTKMTLQTVLNPRFGGMECAPN